MDLDHATAFVRDRSKCVLVTQRRDGRPQLSNVMHAVDGDGVVRVSITTGRAKYKNLAREPWAAVHVTTDDFWQWVVVEGDVSLSEPAAAPDDATVDELVELYRAIAGEHDDWDEFRSVQVREERVVVRLTPTRAYGQLPD